MTAWLCGEDSQELVQVIQSESFESAHFVGAEELPALDAVVAAAESEELNR